MTAIILLFGLGLLLIVAEVLIPSFGVLGGGATLCILGAIGWAYSLDAGLGTQLLVAAVVLVPVSLVFGLKLFPISPLGRRFTARGFSFEDGRGVDRRDDGLVGARGVVVGPCRPAGIATIAGRRVDVVSRGELIDPGVEVVVVEVSGNRVVVARATDSTLPQTPNHP
ncbi:MAG: NfeD family protein [Planctomycetota bacterium]